MDTVTVLAAQIGLKRACEVLAVARASFYRRRRHRAGPRALGRPRRAASQGLSVEERRRVLEILNSQRFLDAAPAQIYAKLLDEGLYLCCERTMYRILYDAQEVRERRNQLRHPTYLKPELLATAPNQVWTWDITKLKTQIRGHHYSLYVVLDIFSRYVVGWMVAECEATTLAEQLFRETLAKQQVGGGELTIHADRGSTMTAKSLALLLDDLGVTRSHSRPHTSNDNPYSEAHFKTLKYEPGFPENFGSLQDARAFCRSFFSWYNTQHYHSGIALLTPDTVHHGRVDQVLRDRTLVLDAAYAAHPERFRRRPKPNRPPAQAWINPPTLDSNVSSSLNTTEPVSQPA
jgi:transposase InsO family protein